MSSFPPDFSNSDSDDTGFHFKVDQTMPATRTTETATAAVTSTWWRRSRPGTETKDMLMLNATPTASSTAATTDEPETIDLTDDQPPTTPDESDFPPSARLLESAELGVDYIKLVGPPLLLARLTRLNFTIGLLLRIEGQKLLVAYSPGSSTLRGTSRILSSRDCPSTSDTNFTRAGNPTRCCADRSARSAATIWRRSSSAPRSKSSRSSTT